MLNAMADVLCITHAGIRCGIAGKYIASAKRQLPKDQCIQLWDAPTAGAEDPEARAVQVLTASGPRWLLGSRVTMVSLGRQQLVDIPPMLETMLALPHIVGLASLDEELVWLVDPRRYRVTVAPHEVATSVLPGT